MTPLNLALKYMEAVFNNGNIDELKEILADDLRFSGPFYEFNSAIEYIDFLNADPPVGFRYELIESFENETSVCLVYQFMKDRVSTPMSQTFKIRDGKISSILLLFDSAALK